MSLEFRGEAASLLIYTAANKEKAKCGRVTRLTDTAANGKREECGRVFCSFIRPQKGKRRNAAVCPASPIRPQLEKGRAAAVHFAHLYGRKKGKCGMRPCAPPPRYGRNWKKIELRPYAAPRSALQIRPQMEKDRAAAVRSAIPASCNVNEVVFLVRAPLPGGKWSTNRMMPRILGLMRSLHLIRISVKQNS